MSTRTENRPSATPTDSPGSPASPSSTAGGPTSRVPTGSPPIDVVPPQAGHTGQAPGRVRRLDLSLAQVVGGSLAAATAAAAGSRLGVIGTISGAAIISVVASVASAFYTTSLRHTGHHMSSVLRRGAGRSSLRQPGIRPPAARPPAARRLVAGAAVVFALAALVVTGVELVTGRSLDGSAGTTIARTVDGTTAPGSRTSEPGPSRHRDGAIPTATSRPSDSASPSASPTATATESGSAEPSPSGSPAVSPSLSSTPTPSATPSASPDPSASGAPTPTASPSASPSASAGDSGPGGGPGGAGALSR